MFFLFAFAACAPFPPCLARAWEGGRRTRSATFFEPPLGENEKQTRARERGVRRKGVQGRSTSHRFLFLSLPVSCIACMWRALGSQGLGSWPIDRTERRRRRMSGRPQV